MNRCALLFALPLVLLAGCGGDDAPAGEGAGVRVVATTTIVGDLVRQVGGEAAEVSQLLEPNTDAHDHEPRPDDVQATSRAQVVVASGDDLDGWIGDVVSQSGTDAPLVDLSEGLPVRRAGEEGSQDDPHWWHDPRNTQAAVGTIRDALSRANPAGKATYARNADAYLERVRALDAGIAACFDRLPAAERKLVTDHDAFGYFAERYGLDVVGAVIPSQTTQAQASAGDVAQLADLIEREGVRAVFAEQALSPKLARAIARQTGATAEFELYGDALGEAGSPGATYLGMQQANADAIVKGLTGGRGSCRVAGL